MRKWLNSLIIFVAIAALLSLQLAYGKPQPMIIREYLGRGTEHEYLPVTVLYDPWGDSSYQDITQERTVSLTFSMKGEVPGVKVSGSIGTTITFKRQYSSSRSPYPDDIGPGIGDSVLLQRFDITWDVWWVWTPRSEWYEYQLVDFQYLGTSQLSRSDIAQDSDTNVEDKTGQMGAYTSLVDTSAYRPLEGWVTYSWTGTIEVEYGFKVNILGLSNVGVTFSTVTSGTQTYITHCYYMDTTERLTFWQCADSAIPDLTMVYSYVFWYNPF